MASTSATDVPPEVQAVNVPDGTTDFIPLRGKKYDLKKPHITEMPITWGNWCKYMFFS